MKVLLAERTFLSATKRKEPVERTEAREAGSPAQVSEASAEGVADLAKVSRRVSSEEGIGAIRSDGLELFRRKQY